MVKRYVAIALSVLLLCIMPLSVFAATTGGSCNGNCGPWIKSCGGVYTILSRSHTFDYKGYTKTCSYKYVIAYTTRQCDYCKQFAENSSNWTHSHGYRNHAAECGWTNGDDTTCYLD